MIIINVRAYNVAYRFSHLWIISIKTNKNQSMYLFFNPTPLVSLSSFLFSISQASLDTDSTLINLIVLLNSLSFNYSNKRYVDSYMLVSFAILWLLAKSFCLTEDLSWS